MFSDTHLYFKVHHHLHPRVVPNTYDLNTKFDILKKIFSYNESTAKNGFLLSVFVLFYDINIRKFLNQGAFTLQVI